MNESILFQINYTVI